MQDFARRAAITLGLLALLISAGCGGAGKSGPAISTPAAELQEAGELPLAAGLAELPPPSSLITAGSPQRKTAAVSGDWRNEGAEFAASLPNNRVLAGVFTATFSPQWSKGDPLSDLAYACHEFLLPDYDYGEFVQLRWTAAPATGQLYIALADWNNDRWRWYRPESAELLRPASLQPHYDDNGRMLVAVALTGSSPATLDWLSIGNRPPEAVVEVVGKQYSFGSLNATFDPSASYDMDGTIVKYEWDWQDDGSFDQISGSGPVQHLFTGEGSHRVRLRVTDNLGRRDGAPVELSVAGSWNHTLGGPGDEHIKDIALAPDGSLWACGTAVTGADQSELAVLHFDAGGQLIYEYYWKTDGILQADHIAMAISMDEAGNAYVLARRNIDGVVSSVIQRHKAVGELTWSREIPGTYGMLEDILVVGEQIYLSGGQWDSLLNAPRGIYVVLNTDGDTSYGRKSFESSNFSAIAWNPGGAIGGELRLCGYVRDPGSDHDLLHASVRFAEEHQYSAHTWGSPTVQEYGEAIVLGEGELETLSMLAANLEIDADNERSTLVRFSIDEGVSCSMDTSKTRALDLTFFGERVMVLSDNSPGVTSIQHYSTVPGFYGSHGYTAALLTTPQSMLNYDNKALAVAGSAVNNSGNFEEEVVSNFQLEDRTWTEYALTYDFHVFSVVNSPANTSTRQPGTADSGGGGQDFWLSLHVPPQIDF